MTEEVIATDFLMLAKNTVRNYAIAISETTTPEVREVLRRHLDDAINTHEATLRYMMDIGYYYVHDSAKQLLVDMDTSNIAFNLK